MNYLVLIIVALAGIALGMYIARRNANGGCIAKQVCTKRFLLECDIIQPWTFRRIF